MLNDAVKIKKQSKTITIHENENIMNISTK